MKILTKITLSCLCASTLLAQTATMEIKSGWNIYGYDTFIDIDKTFSQNENIEIIWKYDSIQEKWMAYSSKSDIQQIIEDNTNIDSNLSIINANEGFWLFGNNEDNISLNIEVIECNNTIVQTDNNTTQKYIEILASLGVDTDNINDVNISQVIEKLQYSYELNWETPPSTPE
jgi:hypothetical protein